jgi:diguanylate cyclase (GGDEF)-like protein
MKELQALLKIGTVLASTNDRKEVLYVLVKIIAEVVDVVRCSVILVDRPASIGRVVATYENPKVNDLQIDLNKYPEIEESITTGQLVLVRNVQKDPRMMLVIPRLQHLDIRSILVIPIVYHEQVLGTLFLRTSRPHRAFSQRELLFCQAAARMTANTLLGLSRYQLVVREKKQLAKQAGRDSLTGLYNLRTLFLRLEEEMAIASRYGRALSYLMLDIDNFKHVNDTFGHRDGDNLLKQVSETILGSIRKADVVARYGGDEFGIILPETDSAGGRIQAERILHALRNLSFPIGSRMVRVSASIGVATVPDEVIKTAEDLIRRADAALYTAKHQGKNRMIASEPATGRSNPTGFPTPGTPESTAA